MPLVNSINFNGNFLCMNENFLRNFDEEIIKLVCKKINFISEKGTYKLSTILNLLKFFEGLQKAEKLSTKISNKIKSFSLI